MLELRNIGNAARKAEGETKKLFAVLKKKKPKTLDEAFDKLHDEVFETVDCLTCANCCKTTSPIFTQRDIDRLAKVFRMKSGEFIDKYLHIDKEDDYVLNSAPCVFLGEDNYCTVYEDRPNACREYPHTNRKKMYQVLDLTLKNTFVCPAVYQIVEELKKVKL